jgi:hypothetical protein
MVSTADEQLAGTTEGIFNSRALVMPETQQLRFNDQY